MLANDMADAIVISILGQIADEISRVRKIGEASEDHAVIDASFEIVAHLTLALEALSEGVGMLTGDMPWWTDRSASD